MLKKVDPAMLRIFTPHLLLDMPRLALLAEFENNDTGDDENHDSYSRVHITHRTLPQFDLKRENACRRDGDAGSPRSD
jgi:hypothetical protein